MIVVLTVVGLLGPLFVGSRVTAAQDADDLAQAFDELGAVVTDDANVPPELQPAFAATEIALPLPAVQNAPEAAPPDTCAAGHILLALRHHVEVAAEQDRYFTHQHNFGGRH